MALVSPGVEVTVIDESQYIPSAVNTVPYFLIATGCLNTQSMHWVPLREVFSEDIFGYLGVSRKK